MGLLRCCLPLSSLPIKKALSELTSLSMCIVVNVGEVVGVSGVHSRILGSFPGIALSRRSYAPVDGCLLRSVLMRCERKSCAILVTSPSTRPSAIKRGSFVSPGERHRPEQGNVSHFPCRKTEFPDFCKHTYYQSALSHLIPGKWTGTGIDNAKGGKEIH